MKNVIFLWILSGMVAFSLLSARLGSSNSRIESNTTRSHSDFEEDSLSIQRGQEIFTSRCFNCHTTYISHAYSETIWTSILDRMRYYAAIDSTQHVDLSHFVLDQLSHTDTSYVVRTIPPYQQW